MIQLALSDNKRERSKFKNKNIKSVPYSKSVDLKYHLPRNNKQESELSIAPPSTIDNSLKFYYEIKRSSLAKIITLAMIIVFLVSLHYWYKNRNQIMLYIGIVLGFLVIFDLIAYKLIAPNKKILQ